MSRDCRVIHRCLLPLFAMMKSRSLSCDLIWWRFVSFFEIINLHDSSSKYFAMGPRTPDMQITFKFVVFSAVWILCFIIVSIVIVITAKQCFFFPSGSFLLPYPIFFAFNIFHCTCILQLCVEFFAARPLIGIIDKSGWSVSSIHEYFLSEWGRTKKKRS